jgi:predicted protein tyrosine phosphatase
MNPTDTKTSTPVPIPDSYWVRASHLDGHQLLAGEYPGSRDPNQARQKLARIVEAGVTFFLDLTEEGEYGMAAYAPLLEEVARVLGRAVAYQRMPIEDRTVPEPEQMVGILDTIDKALAEGQVVYLHCYAGIGRTGTVVGCYLARHGLGGPEALREIRRLRQGVPDGWVTSPEVRVQREMVWNWPVGR